MRRKVLELSSSGSLCCSAAWAFAVLSIGGALRSGDSIKPVALGNEATPAPSGA